MTRDQRWIWQRRAAPYAFLAPLALLFAVFLLYPLGESLLLSFYKTCGPGYRQFVGLDNYRFLLGHDLLFGLAVLNTAAFTLIFLVLQIPMSLGLAMLLNSKRLRCRGVFRFSFFSSYLVGQVFVGVVFFELFSQRGLVNQLAGKIAGGTVTIPWLTSPSLVMPVILIASLWLSVGYGMIYFLAGLQAVDPDLYEAAVVDGAGSWQKFVNVTLPGIRPVLSYVILVGTIGGFQLFELPYVLLQGAGPGGRGLTIVMYLFSTGFGAGDLGYASAIGWTLVVILAIVCLAQVKLLRFGTET
jgi:ABC-type sugar transport system permease subunit